MLKKEIRKLYRDKRMQLSEQERVKSDDLMLIQLQRMAFSDDVKTVMSYWPIELQGEPNTHLFTYYLENHIQDVRICYPQANFEEASMKAILVHDETDFEENAYGIPEPETGEEINPMDIDLVMVPLLAYDKKGYRVGFGKGFYDRFLQKCKPGVITVGFSYFDPIDEIKDTNEFDVPLNYCITPQKIYEF
jgi:5-formyltetrahydrofolate cyclo-ligase